MFKRVFIIASICCLWTQVQAAKLTSYNAIEDAVRHGSQITIVVDWEKCESNYPNIKLDYIGSWTPEGIVVKKGSSVAAQGMTYTYGVSSVPGGDILGPVNQVYKYIISKDEGLEIINRFVDPVTHQEKIPTAKLHCEFSTAFKVYGHEKK